MKKFLQKSAIVFFTLYLLTSLVGLGLDYWIKHSSLYKVNILFNKKLPENIILGSSRALLGVNTPLLDSLTGKKWYNLAMDDSPIEIHLLMYKLLIEQGKKPSQVLLQYDTENDKDRSTEFLKKDFQFLPFLYSSEAVRKHLSNKEKYWLFMAWPFYKYVYFNTELLYTSAKTFIKKDYQERFDEAGDYDYPNDLHLEDTVCHTPKLRNANLNNRSLQELISTCNSNKTDIHVYTAPFYCSSSEVGNTTNYLNMTGEIQDPKYFVDEGHVNKLGKVWITERLVDWLKK